MKTKIKELWKLREEKDAGGGIDKLNQRRDKGLMTARDRIDYLV